MGDTWRGVETITKTGETDQGVTATLKVTELFSKAILLHVCLWRLHGCVLDLIHLSATDVAEVAEFTHL